MRKIKVLLIGPDDPQTPTHGETAYLRLLLDHPPEGVEYIYYLEALKDKGIKRTWEYYFFRFLYRLYLWPDVHVECLRLLDKFDLVHAHVMPVKISSNYKVPVILSDSSSNYYYLNSYKGIPKTIIKLYYYLFRKPLVKLFKIYDGNLNARDAKGLVVWSEFAKKIHLDLGFASKITVVPPPIPLSYKEKIYSHQKVNILFVGMHFKRKGGELLLKAFYELEKKYPDITLTLVGPIPSDVKLMSPRIFSLGFVPWTKLLNEVIPAADIFVLISPKSEGYGLTVLQAMSGGVPCITTNIATFPEIINNGEDGLMIKPDDYSELLEGLEKLISDTILREKMAQKARQKIEQFFSTKVITEKIGKIYKGALEN